MWELDEMRRKGRVFWTWCWVGVGNVSELDGCAFDERLEGREMGSCGERRWHWRGIGRSRKKLRGS